MSEIVRFSYVNIAEPKSINGSKPKYSVSLIILKDDKDTIAKIEASIETAIQKGVGKFGGKIPPHGALKLPLRDGDTEREDESYQNSYFVNANSTTKPGVVDRAANYIDPEQVYSGSYGRATITFYAFNTNGNKGIACGLGNLQLVRDGEPLGGRASAALMLTPLTLALRSCYLHILWIANLCGWWMWRKANPSQTTSLTPYQTLLLRSMRGTPALSASASPHI